MRQEQVGGGLISSTHLRLFICRLKFVIVFKLKKSKKKIQRADTTAILT